MIKLRVLTVSVCLIGDIRSLIEEINKYIFIVANDISNWKWVIWSMTMSMVIKSNDIKEKQNNKIVRYSNHKR